MQASKQHHSRYKKSLRFCPYCKEKTIFRYNRMIFHSSCTKCGYHGIDVKMIEKFPYSKI